MGGRYGGWIYEPCILPFVYNNQSYSGCIKSDSHHEAQCPSMTDRNGNANPGSWMICRNDCPMAGGYNRSQLLKLMVPSLNDEMMKISFTFQALCITATYLVYRS